MRKFIIILLTMTALSVVLSVSFIQAPRTANAQRPFTCSNVCVDKEVRVQERQAKALENIVKELKKLNKR